MSRVRKPSAQMLQLLRSLSESAPHWRHGYDIMTETGLLSGTLYPLLMRMADQGLVESEWQQPERPGRPARHGYRLTARGLRLAASVEEAAPAPGVGPALA